MGSRNPSWSKFVLFFFLQKNISVLSKQPCRLRGNLAARPLAECFEKFLLLGLLSALLFSLLQPAVFGTKYLSFQELMELKGLQVISLDSQNIFSVFIRICSFKNHILQCFIWQKTALPDWLQITHGGKHTEGILFEMLSFKFLYLGWCLQETKQ